MKKIIVLVMLCVAVLLTFSACSASVESISVTKNPKTVYRVGESFDPLDGEITVKHSKGEDTVVRLDDSKVSVSGFNSSTSGEYKLTITYEGKSTNLDITVAKATAIEFAALPRLRYDVGQEIDLDTGVLTVINDFGSPSIVYFNNPGVQFEGFSTEKAVIGKEVTLKFEGLSLKFNITVVHPSIQSLALDTPTTKTAYKTGEEFDLSGGKLRVNYKAAIPSGMKEVYTFAEVKELGKIIYDFSKHNMTTLKSNVELQFGGYSFVYTVDLTSDVESIEISQWPQETYIQYEPFYRGEGSIWVNYEDGQRKLVPLTDSGITIDGFSSDVIADEVAYTISYAGKTVDDDLSVEIIASDASELMKDFAELDRDVFVSWTNLALGDYDNITNMGAEEIATAVRILQEYEQLDGDDYDVFYKYEQRIVTLAFVALHLDVLIEVVKIGYVDFSSMTYEEAAALEISLPIFVDSYEDIKKEISDVFSPYYETILDTVAGTHIYLDDMVLEIDGAAVRAGDLIDALAELLPFYAGWDALGDDVGPGTDFTDERYDFIYDSYLEILKLHDSLKAQYPTAGESDLLSYIGDVIRIVRSWRWDYVDIMLEQMYQNSSDFMADLNDAESDARTLLKYAYPQALSNALYNMMYYYGNYPTFAGLMMKVPLFMYFNGARDAVERLYRDGYESGIFMFEKWVDPEASFKDNKDSDGRTMQQYYDFMRGNDRALIGEFFPNSYYVPTGNVKEFLDNFYILMMDGFYMVFFNSQAPYNVALDPAVDIIREEFYKLSSAERVMVYFIYCEYETANAYHGIVSLYMQNKLNDAERTVYYAFNEMEYNYLLYANQPKQEYAEALIASYNNFRSLYNSLVDKSTFNAVMTNELAFYAEITSWIQYIHTDYSFGDVEDQMVEAITLAMEIINSGGMYSFDQLALIHFELLELQANNATAWDELKGISLVTIDGTTIEEYYELIEAVYQANYGNMELSTTSQDIKDFYDFYINDYLAYYFTANPMQEKDAELKTKFLALGTKAAYFMAYGQDNNGNFIRERLNEHFYRQIADEEGRKLYDEYLLEAIDLTFLYQIKRATPQMIFEARDLFETKYNEYLAKLRAKENGAALEQAYIDAIKDDIAFLNTQLTDPLLASYNAMADGTQKKVVRYITEANFWLNNYSNLPLFFVYTYAAETWVATLSSDETAKNALFDTVLYTANGITVGEAYQDIIDQREQLLIDNASSDADSVRLFNMLIEMGYNYFLTDGYRTGSLGSDLNNIFNLFSSLSVYQQGAFLYLQAGVLSDGSYFGLFETIFGNYLVEQVYPDKADDTDEIALIYNTFKAYKEYIRMYYAISSEFFTTAKIAIDIYEDSGFLPASKTAFDNNPMLKEMYELVDELYKSHSSYTSIDDADFNRLANAMTNMYKTIEAYKLYQSTGDSTYFYVFYSLLNRGMTNMSEQAIAHMQGLTHMGVDFADYYELFEAMTLPSTLGGVFARYFYYADKIIDCWGGIDYLGYMDVHYDGDTLEDIRTIKEYVDALSPADKQIFLDEVGFVYGAMLRYLANNETVTED